MGGTVVPEVKVTRQGHVKVINTLPPQVVIPTKAGIQERRTRMDSRFRGNDGVEP